MHWRNLHISNQGSGRHIVKSCSAAFLLAVIIGLTGCETQTVHLDVMNTNGRDGGGLVPSYDSLMRIGAAARNGGDFVNALGVFRRAAELNPQDPTPLVASGDMLVKLGAIDEAIVAYNNALILNPRNQPALVGLARATLLTGKPALALEPLSRAYAQTPDDPKVLLLLGVTKDLSGQGAEAQAFYRRGLAITPGDPALTVDLALSLALTGDYATSAAVLRPVALAPSGSRQERQVLALVYGLTGNAAEAVRLNRIDLDDAAVEHNLAHYATLRALSPNARRQAILSTGGMGS